MSIQKVITGYANYSHNDLAELASNVVQSMLLDPSLFSDIKPTPKELALLNTAFMDAIASPEHPGRRGQIEIAKHDVVEALKKMATQVNEKWAGNLAVLEKSGFVLTKLPTPQGPIPATLKAWAAARPGGGIDVNAEIPDAHYWAVIYTYSPVSNPDKNPANWKFHYSPTPKTVIKDGLVRGTEYQIAVAFVGSSEELNWFKLSGTVFSY